MSKLNPKQGVQNELFLTKNQSKQLLSKDEVKFNKLVSKIELLEKRLEKTEKSLNDKLDYYVKNIVPLDKQVKDLKYDNIKLLHHCMLENGAFTKSERAEIHEILKEELFDYISYKGVDNIDDFVEELFHELHGESVASYTQNAFEQSKKELENEFARNGFDINLDDIYSEMSQEEIFSKMNEKAEHLKMKMDEKKQNQKTKAKTKKQLEKERKELEITEAKNKSIASIYKQLAKILHPDLELDEEKKIEKQEYMKQLNVAYKKNDIHTLLKLELLWIKKEENSNLSEDKLKIYIEVLKEQVQELEINEQRTFFNPRFEVLHKLVHFPTQIKFIKMDKIKSDYQEEFDSLKMTTNNLKSSKFVPEVKKLIRRHKEKKEVFDFFDSFNPFN